MLADDLLVGDDRWQMTSLALELDGSVMMSVVPSARCPICGTPVDGAIRGIDVRRWIGPGVSSRCACTSGRAVSSATSPPARGRSSRSDSPDSCRVMRLARRKPAVCCWHLHNVPAGEAGARIAKTSRGWSSRSCRISCSGGPMAAAMAGSSRVKLNNSVTSVKAPPCAG